MLGKNPKTFLFYELGGFVDWKFLAEVSGFKF
jgi:hypothetical protein